MSTRRLSRSLDDASPIIKEAFLKAEKKFEAMFPMVNVIVVETHRPQAVQDAYFARGRRPLSEVNALYVKAGLPPITAIQNKSTITKVTKSKHTTYPSVAIDIAFVVGKKTVYDKPEYFREFAKLMCEDKRIKWGADWNMNGKTNDERFIDMPHFELV